MTLTRASNSNQIYKNVAAGYYPANTSATTGLPALPQNCYNPTPGQMLSEYAAYNTSGKLVCGVIERTGTYYPTSDWVFGDAGGSANYLKLNLRTGMYINSQYGELYFFFANGANKHLVATSVYASPSGLGYEHSAVVINDLESAGGAVCAVISGVNKNMYAVAYDGTTEVIANVNSDARLWCFWGVPSAYTELRTRTYNFGTNTWGNVISVTIGNNKKIAKVCACMLSYNVMTCYYNIINSTIS